MRTAQFFLLPAILLTIAGVSFPQKLAADNRVSPLLVIKERKMNELYQKIQQNLQKIQPNLGKSTGEITLQIESAAAQSVEIICTYLITQASINRQSTGKQ